MQEKCADAGREFDACPEARSAVCEGGRRCGLVKACQGDFAGAAESLEQAKKYARSDEEMLFVLAGQIRVNGLSHAACLQDRDRMPER